MTKGAFLDHLEKRLRQFSLQTLLRPLMRSAPEGSHAMTQEIFERITQIGL
jgi:hypothetical protein